MSSQAALKIAFNGEIHRSRVDLNVFHLSDLLRLVAQTFRLEPGSFVIQYTDAEGDRLNVGSDAEYAEACRVFLSSNDAVKSLKFVAVPRHQAAFQEKIADPIVTSIENLIHALTATLEKVKSESWASGAQVHESIDAVRHSMQEIPYEQVAKETTAGAKTAAEGFSSFAQGLVGQIKQFIPEKKDAAAPAAKPEAEQKAPAPPTPVAAPAPVQVVPPPAPVPVAVPAPVATPMTEAPVATGVPVAFSEAELKWADELSLVHNIFPNVSSARVIDMLEQCEGNVNVVLNTLMEDAAHEYEYLGGERDAGVLPAASSQRRCFQDLLGELYAWDTTIEDVFALSENDPKRDEDDAVDAYEETIQLASRPDDGASDAVLSLAAQLLAKHFFKFPHVHMNVVEVMLELCKAERPQAVRINTVRSLMQIVKNPPSAAESLASECSDRIQSEIVRLVEKETSGVIMRHMTQLGKALKERKEAAAQAAVAEDKLAKKKSQKAEKLKKKAEKAAEKEKEREHKKKAAALAATAASASASAFRAAVDAAVAPVLSTNDRDKQRLRRVTSLEDYDDRKDNGKGNREERRSNREDSGASSKGDEKRKRIEELLARPPDQGNGTREERRSSREDSGASSKNDEKRKRIEELLARPPDQPRSLSVTTPTGGSSCPPGPYIFIGNLPVDLRPSEIVSYLAEVDPSMRNQHVQVKYPSRTSGYAFVSLRSTQLAREAIRFVNRVKFHGQMMKANFARGPPCQTLAFVERSGKNRSMEDDDAVRDFDFKKCNRNVWDRLCDALRAYGKLKVIETGKVRFDDVENAKEVIKKHHFNIQSYEIIPIYEPDEQLRHDATRSRPLPPTPPQQQQQQQSSGARQSFSLKSGRVVGDQHVEKESERAPESRRSEKHDRKSDKNDERKSRKRTPSPIPPPKKRENSSNRDKSRSRSASPPVSSKVKQNEARSRRSESHSRSPVAKSRKQSTRGRSQSRSVSPVAVPTAFRKPSESRKKKQRSASASRSRSPVPRSARKEKSRGCSRSRSISPVPARKQETRRRSRSPSPVPVQKKRDQDYESPSTKRHNGARSRSRSPAAAKERKSGSPPPPTRRESPPPANQRQMHSNDAPPARGGPPERAQQSRRKSRSRSGERNRYVPKDMSTYGPAAGNRGDGGAKPNERERNSRENDQPSERSRQLQPERRDGGGGRGSKGGKMSRYGPADSDLPSDRANNNNNGDGRDERRDDRLAPKRERRDSPQHPRTQSFGDNGNNNQEPPPRNEQRRRSRSPPRFGGERARSRSPHNRSRPVDGPQRVMPADSAGGRGRDVNRPLERKNSGSRRGDDRSVAEIAREELERQRQQQQIRRESYSSGNNLSKYGDGGRSDQFPTPPPQRDGGRPRGGSFQKPRSRSRSRSPPARPTQHQLQRQNDFSRDRVHSPLVPPHVREFNRGANAKGSPQFDQHQGRGNNNMRDVPLLDRKHSNNNMRDSPLLDRKHSSNSMRDSPLLHRKQNNNSMRDSPLLDQPKRDRRDSDDGRFERRGRSPPPSPLMVANDRRRPAPPAVEQRNRSHSKTRGGRADDRDGNRKENRQSRRSEKRKERALNDQNNRNRANDQGKDRSKGRPERPLSPVFASPPSGKRLRSLTPSPVRRDTGSNNSNNQRTKSNKTATSRERSRSPILKRPVHNDADDGKKDRLPAEKKRRIDDDDDFLPKPASAAVFDDMDEMMVDYEEDDD